MARRRNRFSGGPLLSGVVAVGLLVGTGAVTACTVPVRKGISVTRSSTVAVTTTSALRHSARSDRPTALVQVGDSKTVCISGTPGSRALLQAQSSTGLRFNCVVTYSDADPTWGNWVDPWITNRTHAPFVAWVEADPKRHQLVDTQDLIPSSETNNPSWTAACAAGDDNAYATKFAKNMIAAGFGYSVIRLGHEMNGTWEIDDLGTTVVQWRQWGQCFAQEVRAMRAVRGAHFLFDWNVNGRYRDIPLADYYPGNAVVDIVGISQYDESGYYLPPVGSPARWKALASEPMGLDEVYAFARQHHKPLSIPEWATVIKLGDDGNYVGHVGAFVATHDVAYQAWFNVGNDNIFQLNKSEAPHSVAAYVRTIARRVATSAAK
jgi:hypothetical protein